MNLSPERPQPSSLIGSPQAHESGLGHTTGTARYIDDLPTPANLRYLATGQSTVAHGRVTRLDLEAVRSAPGVVDVITAQDVPGDLDVGAVYPGDPLLANGIVEFIGQPLFAVVATSQRAAHQALARAAVEYNQAPALLTIEQARVADSTVLPTRTWTVGDAEAALATAPLVLEGELYVRGQEHFYLEGQVALALPGEDDTLVVHSSTQYPGEVQKLVASVLAIPLHKVEVVCRRMGGAFGGKESQAAPLACLAALAAVRSGCAVKYRMPRHDDMVQTGKRHDFACRYRFGFDPQGDLLASSIDLAGLCGYSPDLSEGIVDRAMFHAHNAYYTPATTIIGRRLKTHTVSNTAFRGFGGPQGMIAIEAAFDDAAWRLGMDPLDLRKRNLLRPGASDTPYGQTVTDFVLPALIDDLEAHCDYRTRCAEIDRFNADANGEGSALRRGLSLTPVQFGISFTAKHLNQAGALVSIYTDGSIELTHAGTEMGQGLYTKVAQVVADAFGVPLRQVRNNATRTDKVPNGSPTAASSGSDLNGMAAANACERIQAGLAQFAQTELGWTDPLTYRHGQVTSGDHSLTFHEFITQAYLARTPLSATGFYATPEIHFDKARGFGRPFYYFAHGAAASEVAVDLRTGEYRTLRVDILHDAGRSLNPAIDLGQIEGGFVQGLGWLTCEELLWGDDGRVLSNSPANYKIPTAHDVPEVFNVRFFERPNSEATIHRSKAVGEPPLMLAISAWCALRRACASVNPNRATLAPLAAPATPEAVYRCAQLARDEGR
ncbi:MAG: xanthine dehydrogenase molybdopterin binding subunit [Pseudomonadota bacterium]